MKMTHLTSIRGWTVLALFMGSLTLQAGQKDATHRETGTLCGNSATRVRSIGTFCLASDGNLLVSDRQSNQIKVISPDDELVASWNVGMPMGALACGPDGTVYAGGSGKVVQLNPQGEVVASWRQDAPAKQTQEATAPRRERRGVWPFSYWVEVDPAASRVRSPDVTGLAVTADSVYVALRAQTGYDVYRLERDLSEGSRIIRKLRGCCGQMDIDAVKDQLVVAENSRHMVKLYDRDGKAAGQFGKQDRSCKNGFGSCCGPMNVTVAGGKIYTGESVSPEALIKQFDADGKQLAVIGSAKGPSSCARVTIGATPDGKTVYMLDGSTSPNVIRVLEKRQS